MAQIKRPENHLLRVVEGVLAGVYGTVLDEQAHAELLTHLREAVAAAKAQEMDDTDLEKAFVALPEAERQHLIDLVAKQ